MLTSQRTRAAAGIERAWNLLAGDNWTIVAPDNSQTQLKAIAYDAPTQSSEGLEIDQAGMRLHGMIELCFSKSYLAAKGVTITPSHYFLDASNKRWDLAKEEPIQEYQAPLDGIQNLIVVRIAKAAEVNQSSTVQTFSL